MKVKSFTLIEILISVIILSIVGTSLLIISKNNIYSMERMKNKLNSENEISMILNYKKIEKKEINFKDYLKSKYVNIPEHILKKEEFDKKIEYFISEEDIEKIEELEINLVYKKISYNGQEILNINLEKMK